jgi:hypothetical protein
MSMRAAKAWGKPLSGLSAGIAFWAALTAAAQAADDRTQYTLFNPTPDRLLRDLNTDRPDMTESPFTVDAGRVQLETTLFSFTRSRPDPDGTVTDTYEAGTTNVRLGLTYNSELNVIWQPYGAVRTRPGDGVDALRQSGVGGLEIRTKINLWGNDTFDKPGTTALGLLPYVSLPTDRGNGISPDNVEGGFILPFAIKLTDKFALGLNAAVDVVHNDDASGYHAEYRTSGSLSYDWTEKFSTYYELAGRFGTRDPRGDVGIVATGFSYQVSKNLQFDAGINIGFTNAADRINPFIGVSTRF